MSIGDWAMHFRALWGKWKQHPFHYCTVHASSYFSLFPITNLLSPIKTITDTFYSTEPVHKNYIQVFVSYQNEHYSSNNKLMANTIKGIFYQITTCTFDHTRTPTLQISFFYSVFINILISCPNLKVKTMLAGIYGIGKCNWLSYVSFLKVLNSYPRGNLKR